MAVESDSVPQEVDDLGVMLGAEQGLHALAGLLECHAHLVAVLMQGQQVAELLGEEWQHGLQHLGGDHGGGVVVRIDTWVMGLTPIAARILGAADAHR